VGGERLGLLKRFNGPDAARLQAELVLLVHVRKRCIRVKLRVIGRSLAPLRLALTNSTRLASLGEPGAGQVRLADTALGCENERMCRAGMLIRQGGQPVHNSAQTYKHD
jgi:hypothetical protein